MIYSPPNALHTERCLLRDIRLSDREYMFEYASREEVAQYVLWDRHRTVGNSEDFIKKVLKAYKKGEENLVWGIEYIKEHKFIGSAGLHNLDESNRNAELGYVVSHKYKNRGFATEASSEILRFGFENLKLHRLYARVFPGNKPSARVLEKLGFVKEGTMKQSVYMNNRYHDTILYARINPHN